MHITTNMSVDFYRDNFNSFVNIMPILSIVFYFISFCNNIFVITRIVSVLVDVVFVEVVNCILMHLICQCCIVSVHVDVVAVHSLILQKK
jgi:hypothetical protein